jgi:hypothetical protein
MTGAPAFFAGEAQSELGVAVWPIFDFVDGRKEVPEPGKNPPPPLPRDGTRCSLVGYTLLGGRELRWSLKDVLVGVHGVGCDSL